MRLLLLLLVSTCARAERLVTLDVESHGTFFNTGSGVPLIGFNFGWAVRGGARFGAWGAFVHAEQSLWQGTEYAAHVVPGTFNAALGAEHRFARGLVRSSLALGVSVLLFDTPIDRRGTAGLFVDVRPLGLRWQLDRNFGIGVDPISLAIAAPVLSGIPLVRVQFRTTLVLEVTF